MPSKLLAAVAVVALATAVLALQGSPGIAAPGTTERASVSTAGVQGDALSGYPAISADGTIVAFRASAFNLVPSDTNGADDIFARDRQAGTTERVSVDSAGAQANGSSYEAAVSGDGRYVAFRSPATNLVAADTNALGDIFVHNRQTGATERVSVSSSGAQGSGGHSYEPSVSDDGRYVAFRSRATNLVAGDTNGTDDVFVRDRDTDGDGILDEPGAVATERVSVDSDGVQSNGGSYEPSVSGDGRYVAFRSAASNLVPGDDNAVQDIFVHDRQTGATERASVSGAGGQATDNSYEPAISGDGRYVTFRSRAPNLIAGDTNATDDVFAHDRQTGATERVSVGGGGAQGDGYSANPAVSWDGRFVSFYSDASSFAPSDTNALGDVFVRDRQTGVTVRVSVDSSEGEADGPSDYPALSSDGRLVAIGAQ